MEEPVAMRFKIRLSQIERNLEELKVAERAIRRAREAYQAEEYELVEKTIQTGRNDIPELRKQLHDWQKAHPGIPYSRFASY